MSNVQRLPGAALAIATAAAALAAPALATDGVAIPASWKGGVAGGKAHRQIELKIIGAGALTFTNAYVAVYDGAKWYRFADITSSVAISDTLGFITLIDDCSAYDRICVVGTLSASSVTVVGTPHEIQP